MKPTLLFATLSMVFATPTAFAKSELETLRSLCQEQERQIRQLEDENTKLRSDSGSAYKQPPAPAPLLSSATRMETIANPAPTLATSYTVKAGDSLEKIARKVGSTPEKLAKSNGFKANSVIHPGQKLKLPAGSAPATPTATAAAVAPKPKSNEKTHTVQAGETFSSISKKQGISTDALAAANPSVKATALRPGQILKLRADAPPAPQHAAEAQTPEPLHKSPAPEPSHPAPAIPGAQEQAAVEKSPPPAAAILDKKHLPVPVDTEMTYGAFAAKHGTDIERLNALNGLDLTAATILAKGSELYVPGQR